MSNGRLAIARGPYPSHNLPVLVQRAHAGRVSSHFRRRTLHVLQPVRTLFLREADELVVSDDLRPEDFMKPTRGLFLEAELSLAVMVSVQVVAGARGGLRMME